LFSAIFCSLIIGLPDAPFLFPIRGLYSWPPMASALSPSDSPPLSLSFHLFCVYALLGIAFQRRSSCGAFLLLGIALQRERLSFLCGCHPAHTQEPYTDNLAGHRLPTTILLRGILVAGHRPATRNTFLFEWTPSCSHPRALHRQFSWASPSNDDPPAGHSCCWASPCNEKDLPFCVDAVLFTPKSPTPTI